MQYPAVEGPKIGTPTHCGERVPRTLVYLGTLSYCLGASLETAAGTLGLPSYPTPYAALVPEGPPVVCD